MVFRVLDRVELADADVIPAEVAGRRRELAEGERLRGAGCVPAAKRRF